MDWMKSCYYSRMRPYRDRPDISIPGRWRWCPPGAKTIPYYHLFGSHTNDPGEERIDPPVGEIPQKNGPTRGESNPRYTGQSWCGSAEAWTQGIPYVEGAETAVDVEGVPICCGLGELGPGGLLLGGEADIRTTGGGGGEVGGVGDAPDAPVITAEGGGEIGGVGFPFVPFEYYAEGGIQAGGSSPPIVDPYEPPGISDVEVGGDGSKPYVFSWSADGGVETGDSAEFPFAFSFESTGGVETNGAAELPFALGFRAAGGVEVGKSAMDPPAVEIRAAGGLETGGDRAESVSHRAAGGVEVGPELGFPRGVNIGACAKPLPTVIYGHWFTGKQPEDLCACFTVGPYHARLEWSAAEQAYFGVWVLGTCGALCSVKLEWLGPTPVDWQTTLTFSDGFVLVQGSFGAGFQCEPFIFSMAGFELAQIHYGCAPDPHDTVTFVNFNDSPT